MSNSVDRYESHEGNKPEHTRSSITAAALQLHALPKYTQAAHVFIHVLYSELNPKNKRSG
jgi:hypothetical protein